MIQGWRYWRYGPVDTSAIPRQGPEDPPTVRRTVSRNGGSVYGTVPPVPPATAMGGLSRARPSRPRRSRARAQGHHRPHPPCGGAPRTEPNGARPTAAPRGCSSPRAARIPRVQSTTPRFRRGPRRLVSARPQGSLHPVCRPLGPRVGQPLRRLLDPDLARAYAAAGWSDGSQRVAPPLVMNSCLLYTSPSPRDRG